VDSLVLDFGVFQIACSGLQLKEKDIQDLQQHPPILFSQKKKGKKRKPSTSEGMQRCKGGGGTEPFIYPCCFVSPELTLASFLFLLG